MRHVLAAVLLGTMAALTAGQAAAAEPRYTVVDLGSQEQLDWVQLNDEGQVSGQVGFPFSQAAVRRPNGSIVFFPAFAPYNRSEATASNNVGTTVGFSAFQTSFGAAGAIWDSAGTTVIGDLMLPIDVNDAGQVIGLRAGAGGGAGFLWQAGAVRDLRFGAFPTFVSPDAVNEAGQVVGRGQDLFGVWPLLWPAGATEAIRLGRHTSSFANGAVDINDHGVVVGRLQLGNIPVATKWVDGVPQSLPWFSGTTPRRSLANAINGRGDIVGVTEEPVPTDLGQVAALWTEDGVVDLNGLTDIAGHVLIEAIDINDRGQILALSHDPATYSTNDCCGERFFLLTPEACEPIPEDELASGDAGDGLEDADGDAIPDCWEEDGIPVETEDGDLLTYELPGADPERKDLYVEVDHMAGFAPEPGSLEDVVGAFAAAPVGNPDGSAGIALHVEVDDELPHVPGLGFDQAAHRRRLLGPEVGRAGALRRLLRLRARA